MSHSWAVARYGILRVCAGSVGVKYAFGGGGCEGAVWLLVLWKESCLPKLARLVGSKAEMGW